MCCCLVALVTTANAQTTLEFQQGVNGYEGTYDIYIGLDARDIPDGEFGNVIGSEVQEQFLDGRYFEEQGDTEEIQLLLRFDDLFGEAVGQIPAGSRIRSASLTLTTGESSADAPSGGPYGVAPLLFEFDEGTTWDELDGFGVSADYRGPYHDHGFKGPIDAVETADVTRIVQGWSSGDENFGVVVRAGTTNGWQIFTTGADDPAVRPKLTVEFDSGPTIADEVFTLQEGVDGYNGTTMIRLGPGGTDDGLTLNQEFVDGPNDDGSSPDDQALIRFDDIFASQGGTIPDDASIARATLVVTTADGFRSANSGTNGDFGVHQMLLPWDLETLYADFGDDGPNATDEIGSLLDTTGAVIADAEVHLEITDALKQWQSGSPNYGVTIRAQDTADGWGLHWLAAANPPKLVIELGSSTTTLGDFNEDGQITSEDVDVLAAAIQASSSDSRFDLNSDGTVDALDQTVWVHDIVNTYYGDANLDGVFDSEDFVVVFAAGEYNDETPGNSTWATGDWNADGDFDSGDLVQAFQDGGFETGPRTQAAVPEPSSLLLTVLGLFGVASLARRRC